MTTPDNLRPELEDDDSPREQPEPQGDEQNTDYPNGDDTTEESDHGRSDG